MENAEGLKMVSAVCDKTYFLKRILTKLKCVLFLVHNKYDYTYVTADRKVNPEISEST